jgi:hypothetical protein
MLRELEMQEIAMISGGGKGGSPSVNGPAGKLGVVGAVGLGVVGAEEGAEYGGVLGGFVGAVVGAGVGFAIGYGIAAAYGGYGADDGGEGPSGEGEGEGEGG